MNMNQRVTATHEGRQPAHSFSLSAHLSFEKENGAVILQEHNCNCLPKVVRKRKFQFEPMTILSSPFNQWSFSQFKRVPHKINNL